MKRFLICLAVAVLAACSSSVVRPPRPEVYDFGLPRAGLSENGGWSNVALEIRSPYWHETLGIEYRLLYENPQKLRNYAQSRWAAAPALLLAQRLRQQLGFVALGGPGKCVLRFELDEFSQVFDTPRRGRGIVQGRARIFDHRQQLVDERLFAIEQPGASADARGGVAALLVASEELGRQFAVWLKDLEKRGRLSDCRYTAMENQ